MSRAPRVSTIQHQIEKAGECPACGRKVTRSRTFKASVPKDLTMMEVHAQLTIEANRWTPDFAHKHCKGARP